MLSPVALSEVFDLPEVAMSPVDTAFVAMAVVSVAIAAIVAIVAIVLGLKALDKVNASNVPQTLSGLFKGLEVFTRFLPAAGFRRRTLQDQGIAPQPSPATGSAPPAERPDCVGPSPAVQEQPGETGEANA